MIELKAKQSIFAFIEHMSNLNDVIHNFETIQSTSAQSINEFNTNSVAFVFNINFAFIEHMMSSRNDIHNFESIQRQFLCSMHVEDALQHEINNDYFMKWREWILREIVFEIKCQYITMFYDEFDSYVNVMWIMNCSHNHFLRWIKWREIISINNAKNFEQITRYFQEIFEDISDFRDIHNLMILKRNQDIVLNKLSVDVKSKRKINFLT